MIMYLKHKRSDGRFKVEFVFPGTGKRIRKIITLEEYTDRLLTHPSFSHAAPHPAPRF